MSITDEVNVYDEEFDVISVEEQALMRACDESLTFNAKMLVSWIYKNIEHLPIIRRGMDMLLKHIQTSEGCEMMIKHECLHSLLKVHSTYRKVVEIELIIARILRKLLDCNRTRDKLISTSIESLNLAFSLAHGNMKHSEVVGESIAAIAQCSRSEICRSEIFLRNMLQFIIEIATRHPNSTVILRYTLKLFNWVSTSTERLVQVYELDGVKFALQCMKRHINDGTVLAPGMLLLTRSASAHPPAKAYILKTRAIPVVIHALRALYSEEEIQLEGLKMLQTLAKTQQGYDQITAMKGGWQLICQGTTLGDALIHDIEGDLHNPGWCIGETPFLPEADRNKLVAAQLAQAKIRNKGKKKWTAPELQDYIGREEKGKKLAINNEFNEAYFELISTLDLLPNYGEEKDMWYRRVREYEQENEIRLDDMANTIIEMKKKGKSEVADMEYVKPIFVLGERVSTEMLLKKDKSLEEALHGVL